ncbi:GNAT family N-acetyltransferase [Aminobacter sp. AP02]|uniref:GNAT family N-acetyltransferase n=1 Tax=Aminobacter sp. AP02 TaxID=2135737 RepID=UPI000D6B74F9|nr:GNAT family N-acetyltransferase [Aminobacter sp. AP02]PWK72577.1 acetyltransferase (GNAT) family protein [Aminobacter sp. AP02]
MSISIFSAADIASHLGELGRLLHACVHDGASISFVLPYSQADSEAFWSTKVLPGVEEGTRLVLVAMVEGRIAGSVQLNRDTPPNQPHRAEVNKLLVHPDFRRQGIGLQLMAELERLAREIGRSLITLDTRTGDKAEPLYAALGYQTVGVIPGFARDPMGGDRLDATTIMYKTL